MRVCKAHSCETCVDKTDDLLCGVGRLCVASKCLTGDCHNQFECAGGTVCTKNTCTVGCMPLEFFTSTKNVDVHQAVTNVGYKSGPVCVTVDKGVNVGSDDAAQVSMTTGAFPAGTAVSIVNHGTIAGGGGAGGAGGVMTQDSGSGASGQAGGTALEVTCPVSVDNTDGNIWGGGGGGFGGAAGVDSNGANETGGGGGGGEGYQGGAAGLNPYVNGGGKDPKPGTQTEAGIAGTGESGGDGSLSSSAGGAGGLWGEAAPGPATPVCGANSKAPAACDGSPGAAGKAITGSTHIQWLGGNNATQIKGVVN